MAKSLLKSKKSIALFIAGITLLVLVLSTVRAYSATSKSANDTTDTKNPGVMDVIVEETADGVDSTLTSIVSAFVDELVGWFSPSFSIYQRMGLAGNSADKNERKSYEVSIDKERTNKLSEGYLYLEEDKNINKTNFIVENIFKFSRNFGMALTTVATLFFLSLCLAGRAEHIHDTPIQIVIKYIVSVILIYFSWNIIYEVMTLIGELWTNFVVKGWDNATTLRFDHFSSVYEEGKNDYITLLGKDIIFNFELKTARYRAWLRAGLWFTKWILIFKLLKQVFRLYIEIAERYFVMTMMLFFFPAVTPTIVSNSTSNIFHSYLRMFVSQTFLLCINSVFMKVFIILLEQGVFTGSLLGYVCGIALGKVFMKLDSYMASMGLNVAQTGGGMADSLSGAFTAITSAFRTGSTVKRGMATNASAKATRAIERNDYAAYKRAGAAANVLGKPTPLSEQSFAKQVQNKATLVPTHAGNTVSVPAGTLKNTAASLRIPSVGLANLDKALAERGIPGLNGRDLTITQVDGTDGLSHTAGSIFTVADSKSNDVLGTVNGADAYLPTEVADTYSRENMQNYIPDSVDTWRGITGNTNISEETLPTRDHTSETDHYMQVYSASDGDSLTNYNIYEYAAHPEMASEKGAKLFNDGDDRYVITTSKTQKQVDSKNEEGQA